AWRRRFVFQWAGVRVGRHARYETATRIQTMTKSPDWTPEIGVLGTGRMGSRLAAMFARAGRKVVLGSRDRDRAAELAAALDLPGLRAGSYSEALEAPVVLPAVFSRDGLFDLLDRQCG